MSNEHTERTVVFVKPESIQRHLIGEFINRFERRGMKMVACKMIAPILDEVSKEYVGRLKVVKVNIDENQRTPAKYGIRGIPTLMLFKNGNVEATKVGALSKSQLTAFIDSNLSCTLQIPLPPYTNCAPTRRRRYTGGPF